MAIFQHNLKSGVELELRIRRHHSTRKLTMSYSSKTIKVTAPKVLSDHKIMNFLKEHDSWIEEQFIKETQLLASAKLRISSDLYLTELFPYLGGMVPFYLVPGLLSLLSFEEGELTLIADSIMMQDSWELGAQLEQLLQKDLIAIITPLIDKWSDYLNVKFKGVKLNSAKKRWGSCSSEARLSFNWRLIFVPEFVIESVIIHEMCHLLELNHGQAFKALERKHNPRLAESDQWLREQGWAVLTFELCKN